MIAAVILNHNKPENADKLFEELDGVFDRVELWDSGSSPDKIPKHVTEAFGNIYWAGAWREIIRRYSDYDAVWMIGCDVELKGMAEEYLMCIRESLPFGCWSPCIEGRAHPFMLAENYGHCKPMKVKNVEGMAMAMSGKLLRTLNKIPESKYGFGMDYWFCYMARKFIGENVIDGRVSVYHPPEIGYNEQEAHDEMDKIFGDTYGKDYRRTIFEYDQSYEGNLIHEPPTERADMMTIVTVDNGWTAEEFISVTDDLPNVERVILQKGSTRLDHLAKPGVKIVPYKEGMIECLAEVADIALFWKVGAANLEEYKYLLDVGVPTICNVAYSRNLIKHEEDGYLFGNEDWCRTWLKKLLTEPELREKVTANRGQKTQVEKAPKEAATLERKPLQEVMSSTGSELMVSVITPTYKRDLDIIRRSINCLQLQRVSNWEQLICSNGIEEPEVRNMVQEINDDRVVYSHCEAPEGDFGNYARKAMLNEARGKYVMFFDDDNIILPDFFTIMVSALEDSGADYAVAQVMHFGPLNEAVAGKPPVVLDGRQIELFHIDPLQFLVRREVMQEIGWDTANGYISDGITLQKLNGRPMVQVPMVLGVHV